MPQKLHDENAEWLGRRSVCILVHTGGTRAQLDWMVFDVSRKLNIEELLREVSEYVRNRKGVGERP